MISPHLKEISSNKSNKSQETSGSFHTSTCSDWDKCWVRSRGDRGTGSFAGSAASVASVASVVVVLAAIATIAAILSSVAVTAITTIATATTIASTAAVSSIAAVAIGGAFMASAVSGRAGGLAGWAGVVGRMRVRRLIVGCAVGRTLCVDVCDCLSDVLTGMGRIGMDNGCCLGDLGGDITFWLSWIGVRRVWMSRVGVRRIWMVGVGLSDCLGIVVVVSGIAYNGR